MHPKMPHKTGLESYENKLVGFFPEQLSWDLTKLYSFDHRALNIYQVLLDGSSRVGLMTLLSAETVLHSRAPSETPSPPRSRQSAGCRFWRQIVSSLRLSPAQHPVIRTELKSNQTSFLGAKGDAGLYFFTTAITWARVPSSWWMLLFNCWIVRLALTLSLSNASTSLRASSCKHKRTTCWPRRCCQSPQFAEKFNGLNLPASWSRSIFIFLSTLTIFCLCFCSLSKSMRRTVMNFLMAGSTLFKGYLLPYLELEHVLFSKEVMVSMNSPMLWISKKYINKTIGDHKCKFSYYRS